MSLKIGNEGFMYYEAGFGLIDGDPAQPCLMLSLEVNEEQKTHIWSVLPLTARMYLPDSRIVAVKATPDAK